MEEIAGKFTASVEGYVFSRYGGKSIRHQLCRSKTDQYATLVEAGLAAQELLRVCINDADRLQYKGIYACVLTSNPEAAEAQGGQPEQVKPPDPGHGFPGLWRCTIG